MAIAKVAKFVLSALQVIAVRHRFLLNTQMMNRLARQCNEIKKTTYNFAENCRVNETLFASCVYMHPFLKRDFHTSSGV